MDQALWVGVLEWVGRYAEQEALDKPCRFVQGSIDARVEGVLT